MDRWLWRLGRSVAVLSGLSALGLLALPLLLLLLMVLFDTTMHGVVVLVELLLGWLRDFVLGGDGGLPLFQTIAFHPLQVAAESLARALPCLAGLMLVLPRRKPKGRWWWIVLFWGLAAAIGGEAPALMLLPGLIIAVIFALGVKGGA